MNPSPRVPSLQKLLELISNFLDRFLIAMFSLAYFIGKRSKAGITKSTTNPQFEDVISDSFQLGVIHRCHDRDLRACQDSQPGQERCMTFANYILKTVVLKKSIESV